MELGLTTTPAGPDRAVVRIDGDIDVFTAPQLREHLFRLVESGLRDLVVDLDGVTFIDSTGLSALVAVLKRVRAEEGGLHLVCTHERTLRLFRITGLPRDFPIHDTVAQAVEAAGGVA